MQKCFLIPDTTHASLVPAQVQGKCIRQTWLSSGNVGGKPARAKPLLPSLITPITPLLYLRVTHILYMLIQFLVMYSCTSLCIYSAQSSMSFENTRHMLLSGQHRPSGTGARLPSAQISEKHATAEQSGPGLQIIRDERCSACII